MKELEPIRKWRIRNNLCCVEVEHSIMESGRNRWNVYAYIYPGHPFFSEMQDEQGAMQKAAYMPLHGGCSYTTIHRRWDGSVSSVQVGCDYNHAFDDYHTLDTEGRSIMRDAQQLFEYLNDPKP